MSTPLALTAVYEPVEEGWVQARIRELPGVITAAPTMAAATEMLEDALREYIAAQMQPDQDAPLGEGAQETLIEVSISA